MEPEKPPALGQTVPLESICLQPGCDVRTVLEVIGRGNLGIALVTDAERHLLGTVTDGDVRRATLAGVGLSESIERLLERPPGSAYARPVSLPQAADADEVLACMRRHDLRHIPLLDPDLRVVGLATFEELHPAAPIPPVEALIMAGGDGRRLRPLTDRTPKPMLRVAERPLMELLVERLRQAGISHLRVSTHYLAEKIVDHFGDGSAFGVHISYLEEDEPLGTGGALGLIRERPETPLLVVNGDLLTEVDFRAMLAFHREQGALLTVGVRRFALQIPYGVVQVEGARVRAIAEKPDHSVLVNAGLYLVEPPALELVPEQSHFDMTELIERLLARGEPVASFPVIEEWIDVGERGELERARGVAHARRSEP